MRLSRASLRSRRADQARRGSRPMAVSRRGSLFFGRTRLWRRSRRGPFTCRPQINGRAPIGRARRRPSLGATTSLNPSRRSPHMRWISRTLGFSRKGPRRTAPTLCAVVRSCMRLGPWRMRGGPACSRVCRRRGVPMLSRRSAPCALYRLDAGFARKPLRAGLGLFTNARRSMTCAHGETS